MLLGDSSSLHAEQVVALRTQKTRISGFVLFI